MRFKLLLIAALLFAANATAYQRICELVIQESALADAGTYTNLPVLFTIANFPTEPMDSDGSYPALSTGNDLEFWSDSGMVTELTGVEVVQFTQNANPALATLQVWVTCTPDGATDTSIWVTWDGTTDNSAGRTNPWGAYAAVYHCEDASGNLTDSTTNALHLTAVGTPTYGATGKIGAGIELNGSTDAFTIADAVVSTYPFTISAWGESDSATVNQAAISLANTGVAQSYWLEWSGIEASDPIRMVHRTTTAVAGGGFAADTFALGAGVLNGISSRIAYANGVSGTENTTTITDLDPRNVFDIGRRNSSIQERYFDGVLDEVRVATSALSAERLAAEHSTSNPATFVIEGTPSEVGGGYVYIPPARRFGHADL